MDRARIPMTAEGLRKLQEELAQLTGKGRRDMSRRIQAARELGDLRENAEYDTAKNDQGLMEARIRQIEDILRRVDTIEDVSNSHPAFVGVGTTVTIDFEGDEETYTIVSPVESNPRVGRISNESPVGRALMGRRPGDRVQITMPTGRVVPAVVKHIGSS